MWRFLKFIGLLILGAIAILFVYGMTLGHLSDKEVVSLAKEAAGKYKVPQKKYVVVIDYDLWIFSERLFVVDMTTKEIVLRSRVSHAIRSGLLFASDLSNQSETNKSCVGAFKTAEAYQGRFGYAMRIDGLQKGVNNNARTRAIVFHDFQAPLTYSFGCFVTRPEINRRLIDMVKGGSLVYVRKT
jgi:hypothetical protein